MENRMLYNLICAPIGLKLTKQSILISPTTNNQQPQIFIIV